MPSPFSQRPEMKGNYLSAEELFTEKARHKADSDNYHTAVSTIYIYFVTQQNKREVIRI